MFTLNEIIIYILSCFLPTVQKDLYLQKRIMEEIENNEFDVYMNSMTYHHFRNELHYN